MALLLLVSSGKELLQFIGEFFGVDVLKLVNPVIGFGLLDDRVQFGDEVQNPLHILRGRSHDERIVPCVGQYLHFDSRVGGRSNLGSGGATSAPSTLGNPSGRQVFHDLGEEVRQLLGACFLQGNLAEFRLRAIRLGVQALDHAGGRGNEGPIALDENGAFLGEWSETVPRCPSPCLKSSTQVVCEVGCVRPAEANDGRDIGAGLGSKILKVLHVHEEHPLLDLGDGSRFLGNQDDGKVTRPLGDADESVHLQHDLEEGVEIRLSNALLPVKENLDAVESGLSLGVVGEVASGVVLAHFHELPKRKSSLLGLVEIKDEVVSVVGDRSFGKDGLGRFLEFQAREQGRSGQKKKGCRNHASHPRDVRGGWTV